MKFIIIEDELHNRRMLEGMLKELRPDWELLAAFDSVKTSVEWLRENEHPELVFMDIQLIDGICFSIFDQVKVQSMVVFTTAYDEYAIQAFKVNSIDYLLKPIKKDELEFAIRKAEQVMQLIEHEESQPDYTEILNAIRKGEKEIPTAFFGSRGYVFFKNRNR